ncbi:MAG: aldose epimerase family protein [Verrucomicrobiota bacterium]|nr:galactose mutarotase [Limisphaera sp.]MDW8382865.1 aldose epimerase family protein [Verrucomicrobiota bacterium]
MSSKADLARLEWREHPTVADGRTVREFVLRNANGLEVRGIGWGATLTAVVVPDRTGGRTNVILAPAELQDYWRGFGGAASVIGRVANRIARARFLLDGREYRLTANHGLHHLHGGRRGFGQVWWELADEGVGGDRSWVRWAYVSPDGEEGYPGTLRVTVTYALTDGDDLEVVYEGRTDQTTVVNLTQHAYFNLAGGGDVRGHELWLAARFYTPADRHLIPTGEIRSVLGTPLDFTQPKLLGTHLDELEPHLGGYDHNYVHGGDGREARLVARLRHPGSGRGMEVWTTEPGLQLYTGNHLGHRGVCLETQHYPDAVNQPHFPSVVLRPGEVYRSRTVFRFRNE